MTKKDQIEFEKKNINSSYRLVKKIIKTKILNKKEACHLAVIFALAKPLYKENNIEQDRKFNLLLIDHINRTYLHRIPRLHRQNIPKR